MASLIENLIDVLNKENLQYQELIKLSEDKTSAIVNNDVVKLQDILGFEQRNIDIINKLETTREDCVKDICCVLNLSQKGMRIDMIIEMLSKQPKEQKALRDIHMKLKKTLDHLMRINNNNKVLLQESMDMIEFELNLARNSVMAPQTANYSKGACEQVGYGSTTSFDAKQ